MKPMHYHTRILNRLRGGFGTALLLGILIPQLAVANPLGPQVISGQASFATQGKTLSVTNSDRAIINWQDFSIANGEITRFIQPTATSAVLNRVIGNNPSAIYGALQSNGRVYLVNSNGIFMGPTATIDVNGLVASTLNITDNDFKAGRINFSGGPLAGRIENQGAIRTPAGGSIYLIAPDVTNSGIVNAPNGDILLAAGQQVSLVESTTPEIAVVISAPGNQALNLGRIIAEAGRIGIYGGLIRHRGIVNADSAVMDKTGAIHFRAMNDITFDKDSSTTANGPKGGTITVQSAEGTTLVSGAIEAQGSSDKGGTVQLLGNHVGLIDNARVDASGENGGGTVLMGGDYQGKNPAVQNAEATYFGKDAVIKADAITNGDGGKVILWGNEATRAYGSISARGGELSGNGGFVETSGKNYLDVNGIRVNTLAPKGKQGNWLLDPTNIVVSVTPPTDFPTLDHVNEFTDDQLGAGHILPATIEAAASNVTLQATDSITVSSPITMTNELVGITAQAGGNIAINAVVTTKGGAINLTANDPGGPPTGAGAISILSAGGGLNTTGGGVTAGANINLTTIGGTGGIAIGGPINAGTGGNVSINSGGAISQSGGTIAALGLTTSSNSGQNLPGSNTVGSFSATNTGGGNISFTNTGNLEVTGINQYTAGELSINNTGNIDITGHIGGVTVASLTATGTGIISQTGGTIAAFGLKTSSVGGVTLNSANLVGDNFSATNTGSGDISFVNTAATLNIITSPGISNTGTGGGVNITNTGNISVSQPIESNGSIELSATGSISINTAFVSANNGNATLNAGGNITLSAGSASAYIYGNPNVNLNLNGDFTFNPGYGSCYVSPASELSTNLTFNNTTGRVMFGMSQATTTTSGNMGFFYGGYIDHPAVMGSSLVISGGDPLNCGGMPTPPTPPPPPPPTCTGGQSWDGAACVCPSGQQLVGNICQTQTITCPTGQQLVGNTCQAITCPTGQQLVGNTCQAITCPTGQQLVGNLCQPIICGGGQQLVGNLCTCPGGKVFIGAGCQCPAGTINYAGVCKTPSIVPGTDTSTVIYFPATEELTEPLQVLVKSIINTVAPSLFKTSGSPAGGAGDDLKPKKNYCN